MARRNHSMNSSLIAKAPSEGYRYQSFDSNCSKPTPSCLFVCSHICGLCFINSRPPCCLQKELSQFWYDEETSTLLAKAALECVGEEGKIACVSSPSVYNQLRKMSESKEHYLFEFDKRFEDKFPGQFVFYDYKSPLQIDSKFSSYFDLVIADPPFLSEECLEKFTQTINFLTNKKIILCTGAIMEEAVKKLLHLQTCNFKPQHEKKLGNEFKCFANFNVDEIIASNKN
ncbi:EEF1A lysine methyltransferase 1 [Araneus ventricosus]|uniref:EEF1A lysine methyltransferase 1 n=1 Tax=Araneus ventricosus TaxID=182803 RepID=A0A4Y2S9J2_ARAVE|nr:EEF1A lysine methyltransferase 1 [Araneus ventricosus]GBN84908.1 EEF1A lysine methyltransferase 1 [Araneus ventricosus]